jgi:rhodanese-related sulfurtransferase/DNA-binding transcriptional ArsR family regulator
LSRAAADRVDHREPALRLATEHVRRAGARVVQELTEERACVAQCPRTVEELARTAGRSTANTSQHLQALHSSGAVTREREGTRVRYALAGEDVLRLWLELRGRIGNMARAGRTCRAELSRRRRGGDRPRSAAAGLGSKDVALVDVRPSEEFDAGHIEGALSIPLEELDQRRGELPDDCEIVAYDRGAYCAYADEAVRRVRASGSQAKRLEGGWPAWQLAKPARPHLTRHVI